MTAAEPAAPSARPLLSRLLLDPYARLGQAVAAAFIAFVVFTKILWPAPGAILLLGAVLGATSALTAMGIVLVYRANRIINFAAGELGAMAGLLAVLLAGGPRWNYWVCITAGMAAALVTGGVVEFVFIRRFAKAPRLILTVATIGVANVLIGAELSLPRAFGHDIAPQNFTTPFNFSWDWPPYIFRGNHLVAVIVVLIAITGLTTFLRTSRYGIAMRAAAESSERAAQLGIPIRRVGTLVWVLAAGLAAAASVLRAPIVGVPIGSVLGPGLLLRALAAAVIGRMENLWVTFCAAVVLGMVEQSVYWATGRTLLADAVLFFVIIGALLLQRRGSVSRADEVGASTWEMVKEVRPIPRELRAVPEILWGKQILGIVVFCLLVFVPLALPTSRANLIATGAILAIVGISLVVLTGWAGEISLGQMALFGFGAATAAKLSSDGRDFFLTLFVAGLVGAVASVAIGIPALRIRGPFLAVASFAFAIATSSFFLNHEFFGSLIVDARVRRPVLFTKFNLETDHTYYYFLLVILGLVFLSARSIRMSRIGRVLVASRDNPRAAQAFGVSVVRARLVAFAFSGFFAALAGALFTYHQHGLSASGFEPRQSLRIFTMVVFGGLGSMPGVIIGAAYFVFTDFFFPVRSLKPLIDGVGLLVVLLVVPGGLGQVIYGVRDRLLRWVAHRRGIVVPSLVADRRVDALEAEKVFESVQS